MEFGVRLCPELHAKKGRSEQQIPVDPVGRGADAFGHRGDPRRPAIFNLIGGSAMPERAVANRERRREVRSWECRDA
jgi:hypothetical protein